MITKFKIFESVDKPKVGDYVKILPDLFEDRLLNDFLETHIGRIIKINYDTQDFKYVVEFDERIPDTNIDCTLGFDEHEFLDWAEDKEALLLKLNTRKYNL